MDLEKVKIHLIAAARPNFMKIAPLFHSLKRKAWIDPVIVHTGQHYDVNMSDAFFHDLKLPAPDIHLGVGSGSHAEQTAKVMIAYEKIIIENKPDLIIVVGDVNSTVACTLAASKISYDHNSKFKVEDSKYLHDLNRPLIAHLEAGLRSFDRSMPEEINRIVTDSLADILWTPSPDGDENLLKEGIPEYKIIQVGNIMIDSLEMLRDEIEKIQVYNKYNLVKGEYGIVTIHRPSNVDNAEILNKICHVLSSISNSIPLLFPVHPRTMKNLEKTGLIKMIDELTNIHIVEPLNYLNFMSAVFNCRVVITDSGGIQEETTYLGIPCLTLRENTERPITVEKGTNQLCSTDNIMEKFDKLMSQDVGYKNIINNWDGKTADRVVDSIEQLFNVSD
jgi:UDP-N-acetylglucosamine 2-epimerase (non-hydrolysing)